MTNIEGYKEILKRCADSDSEEFINNSSGDHAAAMIEQLFLKAKNMVRIFTDHLNPQIYNRPYIIESVADFMKKSDSRLEIIMQLKEDSAVSPSENGFLSALKEYKDKITIYEADGDTKKINNHFMVINTAKGYAMRYEIDINKKIATGTFNAGDAGKNLYDYFDTWINSKKVKEYSKTTIWDN